MGIPNLMEVDVALRQFIGSLARENHHAVRLLSDVLRDQVHAWERQRHKTQGETNEMSLRFIGAVRRLK